jgi:hypothetical protein
MRYPRTTLILMAITLLGGYMLSTSPIATAQPCEGSGVEGDLSGSADVAVIVGRVAPSCSSAFTATKRPASAYYTLEITCSPDRQAALDGVCSATPCPLSFFALRTLHFPDGGTEPAGFQCVTLACDLTPPGTLGCRRLRSAGVGAGWAGQAAFAVLAAFFWGFLVGFLIAG